MLYDKLKLLEQWGVSHSSCIVAFSGGVDSTFLLAALKRHTKLKIRAVTVTPPYVPKWEVEEARQFTGEEGIEHTVVPMSFPEIIRNNPSNRCYLCKRRLFAGILGQAVITGADVVADGTNADDRPEERPGMRALAELGVRSPLRECGFTKEDIRHLCGEWDLSVADKPAYSCLLTRLPHDTMVDTVLFTRIESAERFLHSLGFPAVRARTSGDGTTVRIEAVPEVIQAITGPATFTSVKEKFKALGYNHVLTGKNKTSGGE